MWVRNICLVFIFMVVILVAFSRGIFPVWNRSHEENITLFSWAHAHKAFLESQWSQQISFLKITGELYSDQTVSTKLSQTWFSMYIFAAVRFQNFKHCSKSSWFRLKQRKGTKTSTSYCFRTSMKARCRPNLSFELNYYFHFCLVLISGYRYERIIYLWLVNLLEWISRKQNNCECGSCNLMLVIIKLLIYFNKFSESKGISLLVVSLFLTCNLVLEGKKRSHRNVPRFSYLCHST